MVFENSSGKLWNLQMQKLERNEFCTVLKGEEEMYYLWSSHDWLLTTSWLEEIRGKNSNWRGSGKEKTSIKQHLAPMQRTMHNYSVRHKLHSDQTFGMTSHSPTNYCAKSGSATTRRLRLELAKQLLQKQTVTTNKPRWNQHLNIYHEALDSKTTIRFNWLPRTCDQGTQPKWSRENFRN